MKKVMQKWISITLAIALLCTFVPFSGITFDSIAAEDIDVRITLTPEERETPQEIRNADEDLVGAGEAVGEYDLEPVFYTPEEPDANREAIDALRTLIQESGQIEGLPEDWEAQLEAAFAQAEENDVTDYVLSIVNATLADDPDGIDEQDGMPHYVDQNGNVLPPEQMPDYVETVAASFWDKLGDAFSAIKDIVVDIVTDIISIVTPVVKEIKNRILTSNDTWVGSLKYNLNETTHTAKVTSVQSSVAGIAIPPTIPVRYSDGSEELFTVTSIADYAFTGINSLHVLNVPSTITTIDSGTFKSSRLRYITFEGNALKKVGFEAFAYCDSLKSVYLGTGVTEIGISAFNGCKELQYSVYLSADSMDNKPSNISYDDLADGVSASQQTPFSIPSSVKIIQEYTFYNCEKLSGISIPASVTEIQAFAFAQSGLQSFSSGSGVTRIGGSAFASCKKLNTVTLSVVTEIGMDAFSDDRLLSSLTLSSGLRSIGLGAFKNCEKLGSVTIPSMVTNIGSNAFSFSGLTSISVPSGASLGDGVFSNCSKLTSAAFGSGITSVPGYTFFECPALTSVSIPDVTSVKSHAFYHCRSLGSVNLSKTSEINDSAFAECTALQNVTFRNGTVKLYSSAFKNCTALRQVSFTSANIGMMAFYHCTGLEHVTASDWIMAGDYAFTGCSALKTVQAGTGLTTVGSYAFAKCGQLENVPLASSLTKIGSYAFGECAALQSVTIPNSVTSIGSSAFYKCSALHTVHFGSGITEIPEWTFGLCDKLSDINIPSGVTKIGISAFRHCAALEEIELAGCALAEICDSAFNGCESLTEITYPTSLRTIGNRAFYNCPKLETLILPQGVQTIGAQAYTFCAALTEIVIPDSVVYISGALTFNGCADLESVTIGSGVQKINPYMFCGCSSLESLEIGSSVQSIGSYAFYGCDSLREVFLQNDMELQEYVFLECAALEEITVSESSTRYAAEDGVLYNKDKTVLILCPAGKTGDLVLPDSVTEIAPYAFYDSRITNVTLKSALKTIGTYAFYDCSGLRHIEMSAGNRNNIESIGAFAFYACTRAEGNPIGQNIREIGQYAFYKCYKMFHGATVDLRSAIGTIGAKTFMYCTDLTDVILRDGITFAKDNAFSNHSADLTMYGTSGSYAQGYAAQNGIRFVVIDNTDLAGNVLVYGNPGVGYTLRAVLENTSENAAYTTAWYRNGVQCGTGEKYTVAEADLAHTLTVRLTGTDGFVGELESEPIFIDGPYVQPTLTVNPDSGIELRTVGLTDYLIGVKPWQRADSFLTAADGTISAERAGTGAYVRLMKENCVVAEYRMILFGDVDMDGEVTTADTALIRSYMDGDADFTGMQKLAADVNGDALINSQDLAQIDAAELSLVHVTYTGAYEGVQDVRTGSCVILPKCTQKGYHYIFFCDYDPFDGKMPLTKDIEVSAVLEEDLQIVGAPAKLHTGSAVQLTAQLAVSKEPVEVVWKSSNPDFADVDETGLVTAAAFGKVTVSAEDDLGRKAYCNITVTDDAARIVLRPLGETEMKIGLFQQYSSVEMMLDYAAYNCTDAVRYEWDSDNANVDVENGVVTHTGKYCRTAEITLTAYNAEGEVVARDSVTIRVFKIEKIADFLHKWFGWLGF